MKSKKTVYKKMFARDFCIPLIQMWSKAETTNSRQWTQKSNPRLPYQIFIRENGLVTDYLDEEGIVWIKNELKRLIRQDRNFVKKVVQEFYKRARIIQPIWENPKALGHKQLLEYFQYQEDAWSWFEAVWWTMEMVPKNSTAFRLTRQARISTEKMVTNGDILIRKSLHKLFPQLGKYAEAITIEEIRAKNLPKISELKRRMDRYSFANTELFVEKGISEMEDKFGIKIKSDLSKKKEIAECSGQVAYAGKVRGNVRKSMSRADIRDL